MIREDTAEKNCIYRPACCATSKNTPVLINETNYHDRFNYRLSLDQLSREFGICDTPLTHANTQKSTPDRVVTLSFLQDGQPDLVVAPGHGSGAARARDPAVRLGAATPLMRSASSSWWLVGLPGFHRLPVILYVCVFNASLKP